MAGGSGRSPLGFRDEALDRSLTDCVYLPVESGDEPRRIADDLGYLNVPPGLVLSVEDVNKLPDDGMLVLCTGSQGEPAAALSRMARGQHKDFTLGEGEMLFLYTDGITEAFDRDGGLFNVQRLLEITQNSAARSPNELMLAVIGGVEAFSAGTLQSDDMTCLVIRRNVQAA